jgi:hypothetical protein
MLGDRPTASYPDVLRESVSWNTMTCKHTPAWWHQVTAAAVFVAMAGRGFAVTADTDTNTSAEQRSITADAEQLIANQTQAMAILLSRDASQHVSSALRKHRDRAKRRRQGPRLAARAMCIRRPVRHHSAVASRPTLEVELDIPQDIRATFTASRKYS